MNHISVFICQNLKLDMPGIFKVFFNIESSIRKGLGCFQAGSLKFFRKTNRIVGDSHASATSAGYCFDDNGKAYLLSNFDRFFLVFNGTITSWDNGHAIFTDGFARHCFVSHFADSFSFWTYKIDVAGGTLFSKFSIF